MEHVRGVQFRYRDPVTSTKNVLAQIDATATELDVGAV